MNISWFIKYFHFALHYYPETYSSLVSGFNKISSLPFRNAVRKYAVYSATDALLVWSLRWWWIALKDDHEWDGYHISTRTIWSRRQLVSDERFLAMELANSEANYYLWRIKQISPMARQSYKKRDKSIWTSDHRQTQRTLDSCVLLKHRNANFPQPSALQLSFFLLFSSLISDNLSSNSPLMRALFSVFAFIFFLRLLTVHFIHSHTRGWVRRSRFNNDNLG